MEVGERGRSEIIQGLNIHSSASKKGGEERRKEFSKECSVGSVHESSTGDKYNEGVAY